MSDHKKRLSLALVLEKQHELSLREIELPHELGDADVEISIDVVGICGSDVHYYTHGRIGPYIVNEPMVLGHEAAGTIVRIGAEVKGLKVGDRVCMEPGIPDLSSRASKMGLYNVDPSVSFWATPPIHGCLTDKVIHPAAFTYKLPDNVSFAHGAMVEPFAIGLQSASKAKIMPGDIGLVMGAGPIGVLTALSALAGGCAKVYISDVVQEKLDVAAQYDGIVPILVKNANSVKDVIAAETDGWGVDVLFECSGHPTAYNGIFDPIRPGGCLVFVGMPVEGIALDIVAAQSKEIRMETVFRYANIYNRAIDIIAAGKIDLSSLISATYDFKDSVEAFDRAAAGHALDIKIQIKMPD
ncbi:MAG: NAD(P)-dependent alcohol dehydrogenase [Alphaproteobacteria bacterium]|nr:NAD(P)-dependent alcohol dehydrogenase [Alphaproteobacteria bacterium]